MNHDTLSDPEIDSLLSGLTSPRPESQASGRALESTHADLVTLRSSMSATVAALQAGLAPWAPDIQIKPRQPVRAPLAQIAGDSQIQQLSELENDAMRLFCSRQLITSLVDYRFGGSGSAATRSGDLTLIERRTADLLFDAMHLALRESSADTLVERNHRMTPNADEYWNLAIFDVYIGAGGGELTIAIADQLGPGLPSNENMRSPGSVGGELLIAYLGRVSLAIEALGALRPGDVVTFALNRPIQIVCAGIKLLCRHGAHNGRHALRVLSIESALAAPQMPGYAPQEIELTIELGRAALSEQAFADLTVGQLIVLERGVDELLPLLRGEELYGHGEVLMSAEGPALRIASQT